MPVSAPSLLNPLPAPVGAGWTAPSFTRASIDVAQTVAPRMVQALGARVWSTDGGEYIDFDNAGGAVLLGHRDRSVIAAVSQARDANEPPDRCGAELAERIGAMAPGAEAAVFGADVSQALRAGLTAARLHTGRDLVFACRSAGRDRRSSLPSFPFDDLAALESLLDQYGDATAALVLAPYAIRPPSPGYLAAVRGLADRYGAVLIFDEALSGFRVHEGGAQALWGVRADLAVFGESLANGMALGALVGGRDLVAAAEAAEHPRADIAALAAARAVLAKIECEPVIATLRIGGAEIQAELGARLRAAGLENAVRIEGDPAATRLSFHPAALGLDAADGPAMTSLWLAQCHAGRLFTLGALNMSYAHGDREIGVLLAACEQAAEALALALRLASPSPRSRAASGLG